MKILLCAVMAAQGYSQTQVDLRTQSKSADFSAANATKPFKSGTVLPSVCSTGELFYLSSALPGANLYGCTANNTWTLQSGLPVSPVAPLSGQALVWNGSTNRWEPQSPSNSMASQLGDFSLVRSSTTTLTIGANCSLATPCNARFGNVTYTFTSVATVVLSGGTGLAYVYVANNGALTVGHNLTLSCSSLCSAQSGVNGFPSDAIPLFSWSATNGNWDTTGATDYRAFLSGKNIVPGTGLSSVETSGESIISVDSSLVGLRTAVPSTSGTPCSGGTWATDGTYFYLCVSTNLWKRTALTSW